MHRERDILIMLIIYYQSGRFSAPGAHAVVC